MSSLKAAVLPAMNTLRTDVDTIKCDTHEIKAFVEAYTKTFHGVKGFFRKNGNKIIIFGFGYAVAKGYIPQEIADFLKSLFVG